jgi:hypothetical protein
VETIITIIQIFLVVGFGVGGLAQLTVPHAQYVKLPAQAWANDFKPWQVKLIGFLKLCAIGGMIAALVLPSLAMLMPLAALGIAMVMAGAIATHLRREEYLNIAGNIVYLGLALVVTYGTLPAFAL